MLPGREKAGSVAPPRTATACGLLRFLISKNWTRRLHGQKKKKKCRLEASLVQHSQHTADWGWCPCYFFMVAGPPAQGSRPSSPSMVFIDFLMGSWRPGTCLFFCSNKRRCPGVVGVGMALGVCSLARGHTGRHIPET